jgi:hypothetical protein
MSHSHNWWAWSPKPFKPMFKPFLPKMLRVLHIVIKTSNWELRKYCMKMHYFIFFVGSGPGTCSTQRGPPHIAVQVEMEIPNPNLCRIPTPSTMEWCSLCEDYFMGLKKGTVTADVRTKRPNPSSDVFRLNPRVQRPVQVYHRPRMFIYDDQWRGWCRNVYRTNLDSKYDRRKSWGSTGSALSRPFSPFHSFLVWHLTYYINLAFSRHAITSE